MQSSRSPRAVKPQPFPLSAVRVLVACALFVLSAPLVAWGSVLDESGDPIANTVRVGLIPVTSPTVLDEMPDNGDPDRAVEFVVVYEESFSLAPQQSALWLMALPDYVELLEEPVMVTSRPLELVEDLTSPRWIDYLGGCSGSGCSPEERQKSVGTVSLVDPSTTERRRQVWTDEVMVFRGGLEGLMAAEGGASPSEAHGDETEAGNGAESDSVMDNWDGDDPEDASPDDDASPPRHRLSLVEEACGPDPLGDGGADEPMDEESAPGECAVIVAAHIGPHLSDREPGTTGESRPQSVTMVLRLSSTRGMVAPVALAALPGGPDCPFSGDGPPPAEDPQSPGGERADTGEPGAASPHTTLLTIFAVAQGRLNAQGIGNFPISSGELQLAGSSFEEAYNQMRCGMISDLGAVGLPVFLLEYAAPLNAYLQETLVEHWRETLPSHQSPYLQEHLGGDVAQPGDDSLWVTRLFAGLATHYPHQAYVLERASSQESHRVRILAYGGVSWLRPASCDQQLRFSSLPVRGSLRGAILWLLLGLWWLVLRSGAGRSLSGMYGKLTGQASPVSNATIPGRGGGSDGPTPVTQRSAGVSRSLAALAAATGAALALGGCSPGLSSFNTGEIVPQGDIRFMAAMTAGRDVRHDLNQTPPYDSLNPAPRMLMPEVGLRYGLTDELELGVRVVPLGGKIELLTELLNQEDSPVGLVVGGAAGAFVQPRMNQCISGFERQDDGCYRTSYGGMVLELPVVVGRRLDSGHTLYGGARLSRVAVWSRAVYQDDERQFEPIVVNKYVQRYPVAAFMGVGIEAGPVTVLPEVIFMVSRSLGGSLAIYPVPSVGFQLDYTPPSVVRSSPPRS